MEYDIVGMGTALIDFTPLPNGQTGKRVYECNPGGSIANFLAAAARQGSRCALMGKVGDDVFGKELKTALETNGVDCKGLLLDTQHNTPCAFVSLDENGDRSFVFYRENTADTAYMKMDINYELLQNTRSFHVTSFVFAGDESYESVLESLRFVRKQGTLTTFDVNWRPFIWEKNAPIGMERIRCVMALTDILKVSDEELKVFTGFGLAQARKGADVLLAMGPKLVIVTSGAGGSSFYTSESEGHARVNRVKAVDTTGAGDCCFAVFMHEFLHMGLSLKSVDSRSLIDALEYANCAASYCVQHRGGISSMPAREDIAQVQSDRCMV